jgi:hypothetical protein
MKEKKCKRLTLVAYALKYKVKCRKDILFEMIIEFLKL